jgi:hypothetical protein
MAINAQPIPIDRRIGFLVALPPVQDLLLFAKHLFVAAKLSCESLMDGLLMID